jgi:hypothetical protein
MFERVGRVRAQRERRGRGEADLVGREQLEHPITSVKAVRFSNGPSTRPPNTAFGTLPTPDCNGNSDSGSRFFATS